MKKIILLSIVAIVINFLLILVVVLPLLSSLKEATNKTITIKKESIYFEKELEHAEQFSQSYNDLEIKKEDIDNALINADAPVDLIDFFENTAQATNLKIGIFTSSSTKKDNDPWESMGFNLELLGSFQNFFVFLEKLESGPYFLQFESVQLEKISATELKLGKYSGLSLSDLRTTLKVKVYKK